jgi:hypothetical protein
LPRPPAEPPRDLPADDVLAVVSAEVRPLAEVPLCPVDRLPRRRRNQICIAVIALGLANYLVYTLSYAALGGDARNGYHTVVLNEDGSRESKYVLRGHFVQTLSGREHEVGRATWIYSYVHSITVPLTSGALIISMLVLARPHILATMRGGLFSGQTFVVSFGTIVLLATVGVAALFTWDLIDQLSGS